MGEDVKTDLILKLKEIFRSDRSDLDFGIYRILNFKRKEIERFIEEDLVKQAESEFSELVKANFEEQKSELDGLKEEINRDFGEGTIDERGEVRRLHDAPKIKRYIELKQSIADQERVQTQINEVFNHVYEFFSRYYDKGDFISQRRFGGREKYVIPHNGEEVSLYWVNQDQYYIKTSEDYRKYSFNLGDYNITFKLVDAESEKNNNVGADRFFVIHRELPIRFDEENKRLEVFFEHRPLTEEDLEFYEIGKSSQQNTKFDTIIEKDYETILKPLRDYPDLIGKIKSSKHNDGEKPELKHHLIQYYRKNDMDYFIHKRLGEFLRRELDFYIKNEVLDLDETISKDTKNIKLMQLKIGAIKKISEKIIVFLEQIENFQKKLFEKKKFVLKTNYCISLDRIPRTFYDEIRNNKKQVLEWKQLLKLNETSQGTLFSINNEETLSIEYLKTHQNLVVDTAFFDDDFKYRLLSAVDDIDESTEGLCINSENYQALNLLGKKFENKIKFMYIDPPYNTELDRQTGKFLYKDTFEHSSWICLMENRLLLAKKLLSPSGVIFISIDENEIANLLLLGKRLFGYDPVAQYIWKGRAGKAGTIKSVSYQHEYVIAFATDNTSVSFSLEEREREKGNYFDEKGSYKQEQLRQWGQADRREDRPKMWFGIKNPLNNNEPVFPIKDDGSEGRWRVGEKKAMNLLSAGDLDFVLKNGMWQVYKKIREGKITYSAKGTILEKVGTTAEGTKTIQKLFGERVFEYPKPPQLVEFFLELATDNNDYCMDFFAGSGTTAHAVLNMNTKDEEKRRYILIEINDQYFNIMIQRIKKLIFSQEWEKGLPNISQGTSHMLKYVCLEQYEDTLNNILFSDKDGFAQTTLSKLPDYFLQHVLNVETKDSPTRLTVDRFKTPFDYKIKTLQGREEKTEPVDLVETFNYLLGIRVKKIRQYENEQTKYIVVYGEKGEEPSCTKMLIIWRNYNEATLEKEKQFIEQKILPQFNPNIIYVNVDSLIKGAESIEPKFKELMGA